MCGIAGFVGFSVLTSGALGEIASRMGEVIRHRGPDDAGSWVDEAAQLVLLHRRLSIVDLSPAGHQPMMSSCGRYAIVFNGEIYNHAELRKMLGGSAPAWRGHSDTETLLACFASWGTKETLQAAVGMFAFGLWDTHTRTLVLARDRLGEKPLYYGYVRGSFAFASELKALRVLPGFSGEIDRDALALLMRHNCIPAPWSIFRGIAKLPPGTWLEFSADNFQRQHMPQPSAYWSATEVALAGIGAPLQFASDAEARDALEEQLLLAVKGQMMSDVPLGAFLSGGVDSSTVVALMQRLSSRPVKTFSIGFREDGYDEAQHASAVARHLGTEHTELYVTSHDAMAVIPRLPQMYCEPFSDSSQIPTFLVAQLARERVTVSLSGDGGDEVFCGYTRYFLAARLWSKIARMPRSLRKLAAQGILALPPRGWDQLYHLVAPLIPARMRWPAPGDKLHKGAALLSARSGLDLYRGLVTHWDTRGMVLGAAPAPSLIGVGSAELPTLTEQMMLMDAIGYLPDDILVKVDRAAMAVSLETRVPFIDHRVFEFAWRLPLQYKVRDGVGKWLLREVLYKHVPRQLIDRPKMGFGVPLDSWLRGPLRDWAETLLAEERLLREGFFNPVPIRNKWQEHLSGKRNWQYYLWDVLMFQAWLEKERTH